MSSPRHVERAGGAAGALYHHDKMQSVTISAGLAEGAALGHMLTSLEHTVREVLPPGSRVSYAGESKEFKEASESLTMVFGLAILIIYLVLAAQFESFIHPLTILLAVPPAVTGGLLTLMAFGGTLNVYSQIGLVMLIGLVSKNAILIVEFANQLRARGAAITTAVIDAAVLRLRPILMTTIATLLGTLPLALATGAGAAGRRQIGLVVIGGLLLSTLVTLFMVPAVCHTRSVRTTAHRCSVTPDTGDHRI
ncbi:MAG: efflux RND transporter permease subunit [Nitrospiraceae bacterium]